MLPPVANAIVLTGWASAGVDPRVMGIGPVPAMRKLEARFGVRVADVDLVELNEAFAAQVLAVLRDGPIPAGTLNVNRGSGPITLPLSASRAARACQA